MSNEDKMRKEHWRQWGIAGMPKDKIRLAEETWKAATEACAAIKDAELAEHKELWKDLRNVLEQTQKSLVAAEKEIAARNLMIKELRESLLSLIDLTKGCSYLDADVSENIIKEALAKSEHHNSRALDKYMLTRELFVLIHAASICEPYGEEFQWMITERQAKLAELNKE